jgi:hypothetical protein
VLKTISLEFGVSTLILHPFRVFLGKRILREQLGKLIDNVAV